MVTGEAPIPQISHGLRICPIRASQVSEVAGRFGVRRQPRQRKPTLDGMSAEDAAIKRNVETLRRDGTVVARFDTAQDAAAWRADMRRACRAAGLRIRTGLADADDRIAWTWHVHHVLTEAGDRAARRAMEAAHNGEPRVPFHELVREEQRKMLRVVRDDEPTV